MADKTISQTAPIVKENSSISFDFLNENTPVVSSLDVAKHFLKKHKHVLDDIHRIVSITPKSFAGPNFRLSEYTDSTGRTLPAYLLTRDAFTLLVMGFTGSAATRWKLRYIEAFNALEKAVHENMTDLARQSGYAQGLAEGQSAPAVLIAAQKAYLAGLTEGQGQAEKLKAAPEALVKLPPRKMAVFKTALRYARRGFTGREIAKVTDGNHRQIGHLLSLARKVGLLPPSPFSRGNTPPALPSSGSAGRAVARDSGGRFCRNALPAECIPADAGKEVAHA